MPRPLRILVAEDNEFNAQLLTKLLAKRGHFVRVADNGREASRLAASGAFDLLLLDLHMPDMDGFQVIAAIRAREETEGGRLPVVALTARSRKEDRDRCLAAGMDDFLAKPVQTPQLWAAIDRIVTSQPAHGGLVLHPIDPRVLLASCGGDPAILADICHSLRARLPSRMQEVNDTLAAGDAAALREAAHKLAGMVSAFSTSAGALASELEDLAARGEVAGASAQLEKLWPMAESLVELTAGLTMETLRHAVETAGEPGGEPAV